MAAAICRASMALDSVPVIFELARAASRSTPSSGPAEYITSVLAGCISAGWQGPVFVQGDHYQFNAKKYAADPDGVAETLRKATVDAPGGGLRQHRHRPRPCGLPRVPTGRRAAARQLPARRELAASSVRHRRRGLVVSIGGEIGRSASRTPTRRSCAPTLTASGGIFDATRRHGPARPVQGERPDGHLARWRAAAGWWRGGGQAGLRGAGAAVRGVPQSYGLAGAVQHGASTLPDELFHHFPKVETAEIHLATGFQNALYDHPAFPSALTAEIEGWCRVNAADERKPGETESPVRVQDAQEGAGCQQADPVGAADQGRGSSPTRRHKLSSCSSSSMSAAPVRWSERYVTAPVRHRPLPACLRS